MPGRILTFKDAIAVLLLSIETLHPSAALGLAAADAFLFVQLHQFSALQRWWLTWLCYGDWLWLVSPSNEQTFVSKDAVAPRIKQRSM